MFLFSLTCTARDSGISVEQCCLSHGECPILPEEVGVPFYIGVASVSVSLPWGGKWRPVGLLCVPNAIFLQPEATSRAAQSELTQLPLLGYASMGGGKVGRTNRFAYLGLCSLQWI